MEIKLSDLKSASMSEIQEFFKNKSIFITGATGFVGHVLLSKLLRACPDVEKIYLLLREKKGKTSADRFNELLEDEVFRVVKEECPKSLLKIRPISGDCMKSGLGIAACDREVLRNRVNVVFHVAATVRFDAPIRDAVHMNIRATSDLLDLAREMKNLKAFVHVSTAFSNCVDRTVVEEKLYDPPISPMNLMTLVDKLDEDVLDKITPGLLGNYPNTYIFTKAVAEDVCRLKGSGLPLAIFRPAIVISSQKEPIPGWINNVYGPTGVVAGAAVGLVRVLHTEKNTKANVVPCDYVVNAAIASAWSVGTSELEITMTNNNTTKGNHLTNGSLTNGSLTNGSLTNGSLTNGSLTNGSLTNGSLTNGSLTNGSLTNGSLTNGSLTNGSLTNGSLTNGSLTNCYLPKTIALNGNLANGLSDSHPKLINDVTHQSSEDKTTNQNGSAPRKIPVYNFSCDLMKKPFTWDDFMKSNELHEPSLPSSVSIWAYSLLLCGSKSLSKFYSFLFHICPAFLADTIARLLGKKPRLMDAYIKVHKLSDVLSYFSTREWKMTNDNVRFLWSRLSEADKKLFNFDLNSIDWPEYFRIHCEGIRLFILKESPETIPAAIKRRRKLVLAHYTVLSTMAFLSAYVLINIFRRFIPV